MQFNINPRKKRKHRTQISDERKFAYYFGLVLMGLGFLIFMSSFFSRSFSMTLPLIGAGLTMVGGLLKSVGARGLAGSGVILDPEQAREDLAPYSKMGGGMVKDAIKESGLQFGGTKEVIKVRCRGCDELNDEDAKFCDQCGCEM